jgi:putative transposase
LKINKDEERDMLVTLHAFCLMPNHYHLLVSPRKEEGVAQFMKKVNMGYSKYFNEKYTRTGALWQGKYRSTAIERDAHFGYVLFYIHFNPLDLTKHAWRDGAVQNTHEADAYLRSYRWSSHVDYLEAKPEKIRSFPSITQREVMQDYLKEHGGYDKQYKMLLRDFSNINTEHVMFE